MTDLRISARARRDDPHAVPGRHGAWRDRAISASGDIAITSVESNGGSRGIFTGGNRGDFPNIVTINSGIATANGTDQPLAIADQGQTVNITTDLARFTQSSNGIGVQRGTTIKIKSNTVTTQGNSGRGISIGGFNDPSNRT